MDKPQYPFMSAPRCSATSKRTKKRCGAPAERGKKVCRFHGARGGAPCGKAHGQYKHGRYSKETIENCRAFRLIIRDCRKLINAA